MSDLVTLRRPPRAPRPASWRRNLASANVTIITGCNRSCPDCCCGDVVLRAKPIVFSVDDVARDVAALGDAGVVYLTGGEPTLHPDFPAVAEAARRARGSLPLVLITNGARLVRHAAATRHFDAIRMSVFVEGSNAGSPTDPSIVEEFKKVCPPGVRFEPSVVIHYRTTGGSGTCERIHNTMSTMNGRAYPCCVASGIDGAESTDLLTPGWEDRLLDVAAPCDRCVFGT
jgi:hypothetical protein